jgi:hypothetical protein
MKGVLEACLEKMEANPEEMKSLAKHQLVPKEEATMQTIGALEDQYGDWHPTIRHRGRLKKWTQGDGESQQKLAGAHGWLTRCAIPAKGPGNGIGG